ncbi:MAG: agmatine deiminase family protein [Bacteroidales bacterium]|nr:agmatine deiminase family protein [Bacteroidales bacterium]
MKKVFTILTFVALMAVMTVQAQDRKPDWARWHYLSEEEMNTPVRNENFTETPPPTGEPRFVGEFEPMQGVMIRYPLGIPTSLVVDLSNNCMVYCITTQQSSAQSTFQNAGVNMNNVTFVNAPTDSYWVRDYGPWYIFEDCTPAIVDNRYNRPRPNDDNISQVFANYWNIAMYGMNLQHTGGNMMEDGRGHGVSDELVFNENNNNEENVRQKMREYLGIDPYHVTIDPQGDYIAHVDCWGKYLAPDKILIARLPQSNSHYNDYEQVAQYFENTNCCWGYPYQVFRVDEPGGYTLAPYTNSLILNKSVYVPMGDNATYNQQAIEVYQEAMPGYNIVPVYNNDWSIGWENTDALHCRTRGVMDFNMLFVDHREVLHGEQEWQEEYPVVSKFIAYSGMDLKQDSLLVYYSINGGDYQVAHMTATGNPDEYVGNITGFQGGDEIDYYVFGADESNHRYTQPVFAELDPHHFTVGEQPLTDMGLITETPIVELTMDNPQIEVAVTNANYASSALIAVSEIMEVDNEYLEIMPEYGLPYSLDLGESFHFIMLPNSSLVGKGTVETTVVVKSDGGEVEFHVTIDEGLLVNVTEISAETKLYPNPTSGNFTVKGADVAKVEVYNLVGQKVFETENGERRTENYIDAANWNKGIYLVNIISQNGAVETKKLVVE